MSKNKSNELPTIDPTMLEQVAGGASRVSGRASGNNDQLMQMLTQVTSSIKDLGSKNSGSDPMQMMMMMMMMGGMGGGGAAAAAPAAAPAPPPAPTINISTSVRRGC